MLNTLQACRGAAAILVVLFHASGSIFALPKYFDCKPFGPLFDFGYAGVDFFFVLSGFLMMHVHAKDLGRPHALANYFFKRFTRIYPAYWVILAAVLPVYFLVPGFGAGHERDPGVIVRSVLLLPEPESRLVLVVAWTLVHEVFFYVLFAALILNRRFGVLIFVAWAFGMLASPWLADYAWSFLFSPMNARFLVGIGVAIALQQWRLPRPLWIASLGGVLFLGAGLADSYAGPLDWAGQMMGYMLGGALVVAGVVEAERSNRLSVPGWLTYLGGASYSIYLVHFPALSLLAKLATMSGLDAWLPGQVLFFSIVLGALAVSWVFHRLVEQPMLDLARHISRRDSCTEDPAPIEVIGIRVTLERGFEDSAQAGRIDFAGTTGKLYCDGAVPAGIGLPDPPEMAKREEASG